MTLAVPKALRTDRKLTATLIPGEPLLKSLLRFRLPKYDLAVNRRSDVCDAATFSTSTLRLQMPVISPLTAQIALRILEMIQTGQAPAGSHLRENVVADEFRVSRSPVREALQELAKLRVV